MKYAVNTLPFERGGGITYLEHVLPKLAEKDGTLYVIKSSTDPSFENDQDENVQYINVKFPINNLVFRLMYEQIILPLLLLAKGIDVLYSPYEIVPLFAPCSTVNAIRDPNLFVSIDGRTKMEKMRIWMKRQLGRFSTKRSCYTIYISKYTLEIASRYWSINEDTSKIVHHGINKEDYDNTLEISDHQFKKRIIDLKPFIITVSTIYKHKNFESLIDAYHKLPKRLQDEFTLVIAGGYSRRDYYESIVRRVYSKGLENNILFLGRVPHQKVPFLYSKAEISVLPSKLETFGHPILESMAAGTPIIASNAASIPEIAGDAACLFDPDNPQELADMLEIILTDQEKQKNLIDSGKRRVSDFSWDVTANETYKLLHDASDCTNQGNYSGKDR